MDKCCYAVDEGLTVEKKRSDIVSNSGDPGLSDQKQCFKRRWERTMIQPDPRRLVSVFKVTS